MQKTILTKLFLVVSFALFLLSCTPKTLLPTSVKKAHVQNDPTLYRGDPLQVWGRLSQLSSKQLVDLQTVATNSTEFAWTKLALISKLNSRQTQSLSASLLRFRENYPDHPGNQLFPDDARLKLLASSEPPSHLALLLPERGTFAASGQLVREGFLKAHYKKAAKGYAQNVKFYDTTMATDMPALYKQAMIDGADFVVGPLAKADVSQLLSQNQFRIPVLALNYTDIFWGGLPTNVYEYGLLLEDEVNQLAEHAKKKGLEKVIIIAPQNSWGRRLAIAFSLRWQALNGQVKTTWYYHQAQKFDQDFDDFLQGTSEETQAAPLLIEPKDFAFVIAQANDARLIVPHVKQSLPDLPIYANATAYQAKVGMDKNRLLNDVTMCDLPVNIKTNGTHFKDPLFALGEDAFLLSQSLTRMALLPNFPIYAETGALWLAPNHQIHRKLPCRKIQSGRL